MTDTARDALNRAAALPRPEDVDTRETSVMITLDCLLHAILHGDVPTYTSMTATDVSVYEWYIQAGRIEGRRLHEELIADRVPPEELQWSVEDVQIRFAGDAAVVSYTLRIRGFDEGVELLSVSDETRVFDQSNVGWQCVHVHKSPHGSEDEDDSVEDMDI